MSEPVKSDMTAQQLIAVAVPALQKLIDMWGIFAPTRQQKIVLSATKAALESPEGTAIATSICKYVNPFQEFHAPDGPVAGQVDLALIAPGDGVLAVMVCPTAPGTDATGFNIAAATKITADGKPVADLAGLATYLLVTSDCQVSATIAGGGEDVAPTASTADFKSGVSLT